MMGNTDGPGARPVGPKNTSVKLRSEAACSLETHTGAAEKLQRSTLVAEASFSQRGNTAVSPRNNPQRAAAELRVLALKAALRLVNV